MQGIASSGFALLAMTRYMSSCGGLLRHFMPRNDGLYVNVIARVLAPVAISGMRTE